LKVLIIDNFDSFTYNLHHYVSEFSESCDVFRSDKIIEVEVKKYDKIILSPGPSLPKDHPEIFNILRDYYSSKSILGICLGHQAIAEFFGSDLKNLSEVKHAVTSENIIIREDILFDNLPKRFQVAHYHSWVVDESSLSDNLRVTSKNEEGLVMSINHKKFDVKGIQFHPESVLTPHGKQIIKNWVLS